MHYEKVWGEKVYNGEKGGCRLCCLGCSLGSFGVDEIGGVTKRFEMDG